MGWSIKLGRVFGIDVKIHFTFLLILVWGAFAYGGSAGPLYGVVVTLGLFSLVFLHELEKKPQPTDICCEKDYRQSSL